MLSILQALLKFVLRLGVIFGLAFMITCTVFVIVCIIHGDIKINVIRSKTEEENEQIGNVEVTTIGQYRVMGLLIHKNEKENIKP